MKTNDIDENDLLVTYRQTVFLQNLLNHIRLLFSSISGTSNNLFSTEFYLWMFAQFFGLVFLKKNPTFKIAMSGRAGGCLASGVVPGLPFG